jgi:hypothetical protein
MKRFTLLALLYCTTLKADVLLTDSFDGSSIDSSKWNVSFLMSGSAVSQLNGQVDLVNRGMLSSKQSFASPYEVTGSFINSNDYDVFTALVRSDGKYTGGTGNGIGVFFWSEDGGSIIIYEADKVVPTWVGRGYDVTPNQEHAFKITDNGSSVDIWFNNSFVVNYASSFTAGGEIAFHSREGGTVYGTQQSSLVNVQVNSVVPEPSSLSLLALGGVVVALRRRR